MARRLLPTQNSKDAVQGTFRKMVGFVPQQWRALLLLFLILVVPACITGTLIGSGAMEQIKNLVNALSDINTQPTPIPHPPLAQIMPLTPASIHYEVQDGDSCDAILMLRMSFINASEVFTDQKPNTVAALSRVLGQDCRRLNIGMMLSLLPQYPLVALSGEVLRIGSITGALKPVPTPLIPVPKQYAPDCSDGCQLIVRVSNHVQVRLIVQTTLSIYQGSWIWTQAEMTRKVVKDFATYPYVDSQASLNGMILRAYDLQVDTKHEDTFIATSQVASDAMRTDGGAWMYAVTGPSGLDHWGRLARVPVNTQVLLWLSYGKNGLEHRAGDPAYRYDAPTHSYRPV